MRQIKKKVLLVLSVFAVLIISIAPATAGDMYFGVKTGKAIVDDSAVTKDATNTGVLVGWEQGIVLGDLGVEAEYTTTTGDGEIGSTKFDLDTIAAYVALRTAGPIYFKAKGGMLRVDYGDSSETGSSYGIGLGLGIGIAQLEIEYTNSAVDPSDIAYISVGVQF